MTNEELEQLAQSLHGLRNQADGANAELEALIKAAGGASTASNSIALGLAKADRSSALFTTSLDKGIDSVKSFTNALLDSSRSFSKYSETVNIAGKGVQAFGQALGGLTGGVLAAFGAGLTWGAAVLKWGDRVTPIGESDAALPECEQSALELLERAIKLCNERRRDEA